MTLSSLIETCYLRVRSEGIEFDTDQIVECLHRDYADELKTHAEGMLREALKRRISTILKKAAAEEPGKKYEQLNFLGFEGVPQNISFYDGERVRYIGTEFARLEHLLSALKLRDDNIAWCIERRDEIKRMIDFLIACGGNMTFGQAVTTVAV